MSDTANTDAGSKSPLQSTTIQGAMLSIVGSLAPTLATLIHVPAQDIINVAGAVVAIVGFAMTIIGRMKATKSIA